MTQIATSLAPLTPRSAPRPAHRAESQTESAPVDQVTIGELVSKGQISREKLVERLDQALSKAKLAPLSQLDEARIRQFSEAIPKVDLHRHLEGAISPEALCKVALKHNIKLPTYDVEELRPHIQLTPEDMEAGEADGLKVFLSKFELIGKIFTSPEVIEDISYNVAKDCHDDNLRYSELRFSPMYIATSGGKKPEDVTEEDIGQVTEAVIKGVERASKDLGTHVGLIMICERQMGEDAAWVVERVAEKYKDQGVMALDLANNEYDFPPGPYREVFQAAKQAGLKIVSVS